MAVERIGERLRLAIEAWAGGSINALHKKLHAEKVPGASYAQVHKYLRGETIPPLEFVVAAAELLSVRLEWLATGYGTIREGREDSEGTDVYWQMSEALAEQIPEFKGFTDSLVAFTLTRLMGEYLYLHHPEIASPDLDPDVRWDLETAMCERIARAMAEPYRMLLNKKSPPSGDLLNWYLVSMSEALFVLAVQAYRETGYGRSWLDARGDDEPPAAPAPSPPETQERDR
jgi:hypothetical protein